MTTKRMYSHTTGVGLGLGRPRRRVAMGMFFMSLFSLQAYVQSALLHTAAQAKARNKAKAKAKTKTKTGIGASVGLKYLDDANPYCQACKVIYMAKSAGKATPAEQCKLMPHNQLVSELPFSFVVVVIIIYIITTGIPSWLSDSFYLSRSPPGITPYQRTAGRVPGSCRPHGKE